MRFRELYQAARIAVLEDRGQPHPKASGVSFAGPIEQKNVRNGAPEQFHGGRALAAAGSTVSVCHRSCTYALVRTRRTVAGSMFNCSAIAM